MGLIMEEKCTMMLVKCESDEVIIIDETSQDSIAEQCRAPIKQEPDCCANKQTKVKLELPDVNASKPIGITIKEEQQDAKLIQDAVITSKHVTVNLGSIKSEQIEITDGDSHNEVKQGSIGSHRCNLCGFEAALQCALRDHAWLHFREKPYKCENCDYRTNLKDLFNRHASRHTEERLYECDICEFTSNRIDDLNEHSLIHTGEESSKCRAKPKANLANPNPSRKKRFRCSKCVYGANTRMDLRQHMLNHSGKKLLQCYKCGYKTPAKGHLRQHVRTHFENRVKNYKCSACQSRFLYKKSLLKHMSMRPCKPGHT